jgi:hypothetical protein
MRHMNTHQFHGAAEEEARELVSSRVSQWRCNQFNQIQLNITNLLWIPHKSELIYLGMPLTFCRKFISTGQRTFIRDDNRADELR